MLNVEMLQNTFKWITTKINKTVNFYSVSIPLDIPISSLQLISCVRLFATPWTGACQVSLSITNSRSLLKLMSIESVMPSNHFNCIGILNLGYSGVMRGKEIKISTCIQINLIKWRVKWISLTVLSCVEIKLLTSIYEIITSLPSHC